MKRKERHHLKENELVLTIERMRDFFERRKRDVTIAALGALVVVAAVVGAMLVRERNQSRGVELLAEAMVALSVPVVPAGASGGEDDLPASASLGATGSFSTEAAKLAAALPRLQAAAQAYPDSAAGVTARYHLAGAYAALGRYDEAVAEFDDVVRRAGADTLYGRMARLGKAETQRNAGRIDEAIAAWTSMAAAEADNLPVDAILMKLALAYVEKGDTEGARRTFTQVVDLHPTSPYVSDARSELDGL